MPTWQEQTTDNLRAAAANLRSGVLKAADIVATGRDVSPHKDGVPPSQCGAFSLLFLNATCDELERRGVDASEFRLP